MAYWVDALGSPLARAAPSLIRIKGGDGGRRACSAALFLTFLKHYSSSATKGRGSHWLELAVAGGVDKRPVRAVKHTAEYMMSSSLLSSLRSALSRTTRGIWVVPYHTSSVYVEPI